MDRRGRRGEAGRYARCFSKNAKIFFHPSVRHQRAIVRTIDREDRVPGAVERHEFVRLAELLQFCLDPGDVLR